MSRTERSIATAMRPTPSPSPAQPPRRVLWYRQPPYGYGNRVVPLWEMSFYREACGIPFERLRRMQPCSFVKSVVDWDDSAAAEALRDAKARYCDRYHGRRSAVPLRDPDAYINEVDHDVPAELDPEVIEESERTPSECDDDGAAADADPFAELCFEDLEIVPTGWDVETEPDPDPLASLMRLVEPNN